MDTVKIWLDDIRSAPGGWIRTKTVDETIEELRTGLVEELSLDHDLGEVPDGMGYDEDENGYTVLLWIEEQVFNHNFTPPKIKLHTDNASARVKMKMAIRTIEKMHRKNKEEDDGSGKD